MNAVVKTIEAYSALRSSAVAVAFSSCAAACARRFSASVLLGASGRTQLTALCFVKMTHSASNCCVNRADIR